MKVVILCGGQGTRLREQTEVRPKPMVEIGGRPIMWHIMKAYAEYGLKDFVLCLGYKGYMIKDFFLNYQARMQDFTVELDRTPGASFHDSHGESDWRVTLVDTGELTLTGARVYRIRQHLEDSTFCLTYGDGLSNVNIGELLRFHKTHGKLATVTGVRPPGRFGELRINEGKVAGFAEKPQTSEGFINGGFFVFEPEFVDRYLENRSNLSLEREPLSRAAADGELMMWRHNGFWQPMDTYREWQLLEDMWTDGKAAWKVWS